MEEELNAVQTTLKLAESEGLATEVMYFALVAMQSNPILTIQQALQVGLDEWDL
jgi:hypothetical protein